jgi:antitoxin HigA-1
VPMKNPLHPGRIVRQDCIEPLGLTITEAARALGITRQALNNVVNAKAGISPEMAVRLSKAFGGSAEMWLRLQSNYDLAQIQQDQIEIKRYRRAIPFQPQTVLLAQERSGSGPRSQPPASLDRSIKRAFVPLGMNVPGVLYEPLTLGEKAASASLSCMHND